MSNYYKINYYDTGNGPGLRISIFFSGCTLKCPGCFNEKLWDFNVGKIFTKEVYEKEIKDKVNDHISGLSILGGDPFHPNNITTTYLLVKWFKEDFPNKNIWCWTGYTFEEITSEIYGMQLKILDYLDDIPFHTLEKIDVLIDGRFHIQERDLTLKWRGSKNQRVIDMNKTLARGTVQLLEE